MREPGWITKAEAAVLLDVDERTIERRARAGRISAKARPGFPTLYLAADVEMLRQTSPGEVQTGILEAVPPASSNGSGAMAALRRDSSPFEDRLAELLQVVIGAIVHGPTGATGPTGGPTSPTLSAEERASQYIRLEEAAAIKGFTVARMRRLCQTESVPAIKDRGWKIRRKDLEQL